MVKRAAQWLGTAVWLAGVGLFKDKVIGILIGTAPTQTDNRTTFAWMHPVELAMRLAALLPSLAQAGDDGRFYDAPGRYQGRTSTDTANPKQKPPRAAPWAAS